MSAVPSTLPNHKIVVVEDSEAVRRSLTLLLRTRGFAVEAFASAVELIGLRRVPDADCLLIDYKLPRMDGLALLPQLRAAGCTAPAILITGYFTNELKSRALQAGFDCIMDKPPERLTLVDQINRMIADSANRS